MKEIKAFIRPEKLSTVTEHLKKIHFCCFTVIEGEGVGDYADPDTEFPSLNFPFLHNKIVKIELVCDKKDVDAIVNTIKKYAQTGHSGDGLIYISNVERKVRIREN